MSALDRRVLCTYLGIGKVGILRYVHHTWEVFDSWVGKGTCSGAVQ